MKTKTTGLSLALCFFATALCFADDLQMGTPKLNESKSKPTPDTTKIMPTYISLVKFTDQGIRGAKQTTQRLAEWAGKVPHPDNACFHGFRDGKDPRQDTVTAHDQRRAFEMTNSAIETH